MKFVFKTLRRTLPPVCLVSLAAFASAATITGSVKNATTGKPAAGDNVVLLTLKNGMDEAGRTTADKSGHFELSAEGNGPFLIRVTHDQVNYHKAVPPGTTTADVEVYDANARASDVTGTVYDMAMQARDNYIDVQEVYAVTNESKPPRTYNPDRTLKMTLPAGAQIEDSLVSGPGGMPVKSAPVPSGTPGEYAFAYPIRPGQTTFTVVYRLPYSGQLNFDPKPQYQFQHFAVQVPKSMKLTPTSDLLKSIQDQNGTTAYLALNAKPGDNLKFTVAGTGEFPRDAQNGGGGGPGEAGGGGQQGPGGGIGAPEGTPDPLHKYSWWILGGFAVALAGGAVYVVKRPAPAAAAAVSAVSNGHAPAPAVQPPAKRAVPAPTPSAPASLPHGGSLLDLLKDELFQLEIEHHQGGITRAEYDRAKGAFDIVIARTLKRSSKS
ncbi:MAG: carboxypeptidase regulatory-like domain-containing protein [Acidobacteria bacterium]|nr:carboxypeptidase regulatory-like domain-containing protein [Acidobacteriota bacterium]